MCSDNGYITTYMYFSEAFYGYFCLAFFCLLMAVCASSPLLLTAYVEQFRENLPALVWLALTYIAVDEKPPCEWCAFIVHTSSHCFDRFLVCVDFRCAELTSSECKIALSLIVLPPFSESMAAPCISIPSSCCSYGDN